MIVLAGDTLQPTSGESFQTQQVVSVTTQTTQSTVSSVLENQQQQILPQQQPHMQQNCSTSGQLLFFCYLLCLA